MFVTLFSIIGFFQVKTATMTTKIVELP